MNRKLIKLLVTYYAEYWKSRNKLHNNKRVNYEHVIFWKERLENLILNSNKLGMIEFL